jgi:hypothetical protein
MDELDVLRAARPEPPAPAATTLTAARLKVLAEAENGRSRRFSAPRLPVRRLAIAGGLAAAVTVGFALVPGGDDTSPIGTPPADAAVLLKHAADAARRDTSLAPRPGQWIYIDSKVKGIPNEVTGWGPSVGQQIPSQGKTFHVQTWTPGYIKTVKPRPCPPKKRPCAIDISPENSRTVIELVDGKDPGWGTVIGGPGWNPDDLNFLGSLPTDPGLLLKKVYEYADVDPNRSRDQEAFDIIADTIDGYVPPRLRGALFEALAQIPGVTITRDATDLAGRHGLGITRADRDQSTQIIVDRTTSRYLGDREVALRPLGKGIKPGTVLRWSAQLGAAVVDKPRQLPR